jgi:hypothetical protein
MNPSGPPGHVLSVIANPDSPIIVNMQFFAGCKTALPQWCLVEADGRLTGGDVVALRLADERR